MEDFKFYMPTAVYSGKGVVQKQRELFRSYGKKAYIISYKISGRHLAMEDVTAVLESAGIPYMVGTSIEENPCVETVADAARQGLESGTDFIVGIGGGSPLDAAKAVGVLMKNPDVDPSALYSNATLMSIPILTIPTTAGTGSDFSPHPCAKNVTVKCVNYMREALVREGAPADIFQVIEDPSISLSQELMKRANLVIATGGRPMVKSAYSSGTPAYGSGAGNATVIFDETTIPEEAAHNTRISKCSDFGSGCSCDGNLVIHASVYDAVVECLKKEGGYLAGKEEAEKMKQVMWDGNGHRLPNTVAISP